MESLLFEGKSQNKKGCFKTINQSAQPLFHSYLKSGGNVWESNPPSATFATPQRI